MSSDQARAFHNNNPGNIERGAKWQGLCPPEEMTKEQADESRFAVFQSPKWGFRAMAVTLIAYQDKYKINTIRKVISRWAPPTENDTPAYIAHVFRLTGFGIDDALDLHTYESLAPLTKAIATHESGKWVFNDRDLDAGLRMAGVEPPSPSLKTSRTMIAQGSAGFAAGGGALIEALSEAQDQVSQLTPYLQSAKWIMLAIILAGIAVTVYARIDDYKRAKR